MLKDRVTLAFLCAAYDEEEIKDGDGEMLVHFTQHRTQKVGILLPKKADEGAKDLP
ncbi:MAG: hypothetical protein ACLTS6_17895 [Anaerobutyricum sp.]